MLKNKTIILIYSQPQIKIMKVNRKVSDLARKLNYIGGTPEKRREIIKEYSKPIYKLIGIDNIIKKQIDKKLKYIVFIETIENINTLSRH